MKVTHLRALIVKQLQLKVRRVDDPGNTYFMLQDIHSTSGSCSKRLAPRRQNKEKGKPFQIQFPSFADGTIINAPFVNKLYYAHCSDCYFSLLV